YPQLELAQTYELKSDLIHLLPKFHGLAGEDPYKHLKEFHVVCSTMRSQGIPKDYIKMKVYEGLAIFAVDSLQHLGRHEAHVSGEVVSSIKNCDHQERDIMIDAASGGALMDKMPAIVRHLISNMASNTQQFGIKGASQPRMVNEIDAIDNLRMENQLIELTSLVRQLAVG
ncbi:hypothetical protein CR513_51792, partial [Mucuna pruriens]